jgi:hypothetical protein
MKMTVFWDVASCSLTEINRRFRNASSFFALVLEAVSTSETLINFCETMWCNIPKDGHLPDGGITNKIWEINFITFLRNYSSKPHWRLHNPELTKQRC